MSSSRPMPVFRPSRLALFVLLTLLMLLSGCGDKSEDKQASKAEKQKSEQPAAQSSQQPQQAPPKIKVVEVTPVKVPFIAEYSASLEAKETVEIRARVAGYLQKRHFEEGSSVKKGDLLFTIDPSQYQEALKEAQSQLARDRATMEKAKVDLQRFSQLYKTGAISREELDTRATTAKELEATVEQDNAAVKQAQLNLGYTTIEAPISGRIGRAQKQKGDLVGQGENTLLATITSVDPIYVNFNISESDYLQYMKQAQQEKTPPKVVPILVMGDGSLYGQKGTINMVDPTVNEDTGTIGVRVTFPNSMGLLRPGQFARIRLAVERDEKAILLPQRALKDVQGMKMCLVADKDGKVQSKTVTPGQELGSFVVITKGLEAGDLVLIEGLQKINPGQTIEPEKTELDFSELKTSLGGDNETDSQQSGAAASENGETMDEGAAQSPNASGGAQ